VGKAGAYVLAGMTSTPVIERSVIRVWAQLDGATRVAQLHANLCNCHHCESVQQERGVESEGDRFHAHTEWPEFPPIRRIQSKTTKWTAGWRLERSG